jgi:hypothetical protein
MLPNHQGSCPDLPGYPAQWFHLRDLHLCDNLFRRAMDNNECIIYNFGVGKQDPFLRFMRDQETYSTRCKIYAFDPFIQASHVKARYPDVEFYQIGLWNGHSNRTVKDGGQLKSLPEIQEMLNHTSKTRITLFRSDCEGCEFGWVKQAMDDDPTLFERIDQMFMEIHTTKIEFMDSIELSWEQGLPPTSLLEPVYRMLTDHFRVLDAAINPGGPPDRWKTPMNLRRDGVLGFPCCRELNLISTRHAAPPKLDGGANEQCQEPHSNEGGEPSLDTFSDEFASLFHGRRKTCTGGETPKCSDGNCFCHDALAADEQSEQCLIYFFGNFALSKDVSLLQNLANSYPRCFIQAFDHRWSVDFWPDSNITQALGGNVVFQPWSLFSGQGGRVSITPRVNDSGTELEAIGELYTMAEIVLSWTRKPKSFPSSKNVTNLRPDRISLLRIDWSSVSPCIWQKEILSEANCWWGKYDGAKTVQQLL